MVTKNIRTRNITDHRDTLKGRRVFVQLVITFRHGTEDQETMGLSFKKELILDRVQVELLALHSVLY